MTDPALLSAIDQAGACGREVFSSFNVDLEDKDILRAVIVATCLYSGLKTEEARVAWLLCLSERLAA